MIIEIIFEDEQPQNNVISFSSYADRIGAKPSRDFSWEDTLVRLSGQNVIDLHARRS